MKKLMISTDSTADLPAEYLKQHNIDTHPLYFSFGKDLYGGSNTLEPDEFYNRMREGEMPVTSASNPEFIRSLYQKELAEGYDILHISFSSALSSSYNNAAVTAQQVMSEEPDSRIVVIDSLAASLGQGLLVHKAVCMRNEGKTLDEIVSWLEENKLHLCHQFTVDDLFHLQRGGRVSRTTALLGTLINIKPLLHVNDSGQLIPLRNIRGRKKSLIALVDEMETKIDGFDNDIIFISHGDCLEDAQFVAEQIQKRFGIDNFLIHYVSPTIGAHSGPGTVALFFLGKNR